MKTLYLLFIFSIIWFYVDYNIKDDSESSWWDQVYTNETLFDPVDEPLYSAEDKLCLQKNVFFEAATESKKGQIAVAMVTLNRVNSKRFPNTICGVVQQAKFQPNGLPVINQCQFSWFCDGLSDRPDLQHPYTKKVWDSIGFLINDVLDEKYDNPIGKSTFYHSKKVRPAWSEQFYVHSEIGAHIFYTRGL